jgi:hypothetical protein
MRLCMFAARISDIIESICISFFNSLIRLELPKMMEGPKGNA